MTSVRITNANTPSLLSPFGGSPSQIIMHAYDRDDIAIEELMHYAKTNGIEPVLTCSLCDRPLPEDEEIPICPRCQGSAKAHARLDRETAEWREDGSPD